MTAKNKPKLKPVGITTTYRFDIRKTVSKTSTYRFSIHEIEDSVKQALREAGVTNITQLVLKNHREINELNRKLSEFGETNRDIEKIKKMTESLFKKYQV